MPPQKRAATKPTPEAAAEPEQGEILPAEAEPTEEQPAPESAETQTPNPGPEQPDEPTVQPPAEPDPAQGADPLCPLHFPHGWPDDATSAGCEHSTWTRTL